MPMLLEMLLHVYFIWSLQLILLSVITVFKHVFLHETSLNYYILNKLSFNSPPRGVTMLNLEH